MFGHVQRIVRTPRRALELNAYYEKEKCGDQEQDGSDACWKAVRSEGRAVKKSKGSDCGKKKEIGGFSFIDKMGISLEEEGGVGGGEEEEEALPRACCVF
jgi:hypothetical protein